MASFPGQKAGASPAAPTTPSNLTATPLPSGTQISLQWNQSQDGDLSITYIISRCSGAACTNFAVIASTVANAQNYVDSGLSLATSYSYTIQAIDGSGNLSGVSNIATALTPAQPLSLTQTQSQLNFANKWPYEQWPAQKAAISAGFLAPVLAPTIPGSFTAVAVSSTEIDLSWTASTEPNVPISLYTITISPGSLIVQISAPTTVFNNTGLNPSTTYSYTISATDTHGNTSGTTATSATTQTPVSPSLNFPRIAVVANGGDQSYGQGTTTGFTSYTASGPGTPAYDAAQFLGSFDIVMPLGASFEGFQTATRTKQNLVQAIKGLGSFPNVKNASRTPKVFLYCIMESSQNATSGLPYQGLANLIRANNWWTYETGGGAGTIQPAGASGFFEVNYSYAWNTAVGSAARDASICGHVYGTLSNSQGPAQSAATYFSSALLTTNVLDSRFTGLTNGAAPNADGLFLDNCFIFPNGGGGLSPASSSWDGIGTQSNSAIAAYPSGASTLLARGQQKFFATMQSYLASCNPGSTYYSIGNIGGYSNTVGNGNIANVTANALANTLQGGIMEDTFGSGGNALQSFQTFAQVITNYNFGMDFCLAPKLFCLHARMPATDGSATATWRINGAATTVSAGTAAEYQCMRAALCTALMDNGYFAVGTSGNIWQTTRYYDEFGDDSLTQVNVKRGYLGQPVSGTRPSAAAFANGVWARQFTNGIVLVNPWLNGTQTITSAQLTAAFGGSYRTINGTQQPGINTGAAFTSRTFGDPDGLILINVVAPTIQTASPLPAATQGTAYSTTITATGGSTPYIWSIVSDTPDTGSWLTINSSTGVLSGTPGTAETETVVIKVQDSLGATANKTFSLTVNASVTWQLAAGHYDPSVAVPIIAFPRPDSETNTYERHRLCPAGIPWRFPVGMIYGAWPNQYTIISGPAGLTIGQTYGSANYQIMNWANPVAGTYSVTVQVTTQDFGRIGSSADPIGQYQVTFTLVVAPQTDPRFFCIDAVNGNNANPGTLALPWKTLTAFNAASTNGGQLFFRNGTYNFNVLTSLLDLTNKAKVFVGYPGETAVINYGGTWSGASCYTGFFGTGCSSSNITWSGSPSNWAGGSSDLFYINHAGDRGVYYENTFSGLDGKLTAPANFSNWCGIAMFASAAMHKYVGSVNNTLQNFNGMNNGGGIIWYSVKNWLIEGTTIQGFTNAGNAQSGFYLKGHCSIGTLRNCRVPNQSISTSPMHIYQGPDGGSGDAPNGNEICWNYAVLTPPGNNGSNGSAHTYGPASYSSWNGWTHRNTVIGATFFAAVTGFNSTLKVNNNVLCTEHAGRINDALFYGAQPNLIETDTANVLDTFANRNSVVDPVTGFILSAYATAHGITIGTVGHQVA